MNNIRILNRFFLIVAATFLILPSIFAKPFDGVATQKAFNSLMDNVQQAVQPKITWQNFNEFPQFISSAKKGFEILVQARERGAFDLDQESLKACENLCELVAKLSKVVKTPADLRPRHGRWLGYAAGKLYDAIEENPYTDSAYSIQYFCKTLQQEICVYIAVLVGTNAQRRLDLLVHRPWDWFTRNWWWVVPTTVAVAGAGKLFWDAAYYKKSIRIDPSLWNKPEADAEEKSLYGKFVAGVAGLLLTSVLFGQHDGIISLENGGYIGRPINNEPAHQEVKINRIAVKMQPRKQIREIWDPESKANVSKELPVMISRVDKDGNPKLVGYQMGQVQVVKKRVLKNLGKRKIMQIPSLYQKEGAYCGYYALYNAWCLKRFEKLEDLGRAILDRGKIDAKIKQWEEIVLNNGNDAQLDWLRPEVVEVILQNDDELGMYEDKKNNVYKEGMDRGMVAGVSIIEKETIDPMLNAKHELPRDFAFAGDRVVNSIAENIWNFRNKKQSQVVILLTPGHWRAFRLAWEGDVVLIAVVDSLNHDCTNDYAIDWLYYLFVNQAIEGFDQMGGVLAARDVAR